MSEFINAACAVGLMLLFFGGVWLTAWYSGDFDRKKK